GGCRGGGTGLSRAIPAQGAVLALSAVMRLIYCAARRQLRGRLARAAASFRRGRQVGDIAVDQHEQEAAQRHPVEHEGKEADPPKQVHQEGDRQNSGYESESGDQEFTGGDVTAALQGVPDRKHNRGGGRRNAEKERESSGIGPGEIEKARGSHGDSGTAGSGDESERLRTSDQDRVLQG